MLSSIQQHTHQNISLQVIEGALFVVQFTSTLVACYVERDAPNEENTPLPLFTNA